MEIDVQWLSRLASAMGYSLVELPEREGVRFALEPTSDATFSGAGLNVEPVPRAELDFGHLCNVLAMAIERVVAALMMRLRPLAADPDSLLQCGKLANLAKLMLTPVDEAHSGLSNQAILDLSTKLIVIAGMLRGQTDVGRN